MTIPRLKRVKVASEGALRSWLQKNAAQTQDVMIVTCNAKSPAKHVSSRQVRDVLHQNGWVAGMSYTLDGDLLGHVASPS